MSRRKTAAAKRLCVESLEIRTVLSAIGIVGPTLPADLSATALVGPAAPIKHPMGPVIAQLSGTPMINSSTVPANGDVNPYGVAFVPSDIAKGGKLHPGDILVSNFNNSDNLQGTGTTIVDIAPNGKQSLFYQGPSGLGLTTALGVLSRGFVLVGNVPSTDGTSNTVQQGSLIILDKNGNQVANLTNSVKLDGPWDLTVFDQGSHAMVFVSNVLSGTVTRLDLMIPAIGNHITVSSMTTIGSGYIHHGDPAAFEVGPTGLAYDPAHDMLYVASTGDNAIYAIPRAGERLGDAGKGALVYRDQAHLRGPLGLVLLPSGNLIAANGDAVNGDPSQPSELVEFTPGGKFIGQTSVDTGGQGGAFGIAISATTGDDIRFAAVDDITNKLKVWDVDTDHDR